MFDKKIVLSIMQSRELRASHVEHGVEVTIGYVLRGHFSYIIDVFFYLTHIFLQEFNEKCSFEEHR